MSFEGFLEVRKFLKRFEKLLQSANQAFVNFTTFVESTNPFSWFETADLLPLDYICTLGMFSCSFVFAYQDFYS